jgi:hypothetical protein
MYFILIGLAFSNHLSFDRPHMTGLSVHLKSKFVTIEFHPQKNPQIGEILNT